MLSFCRDPFVVQLHKLGFSLVPLANAGIQPLDVFGRQGKELFRLARLNELFQAIDTPVPEVASNIKAADLDVNRTDFMDAGLGAMLMARWLGNAKAGIDTKIGRTSKFRFQLGDLLRDQIGLHSLDAFLADAALQEIGPTVSEMLEHDEVYVVVSVLKARSLDVSSKEGSLVSANIDVPEIEGGPLSVKASVKVRNEDNSSITFESDVPLAFAFQAAQLCFANGIYRSLHIDRKGMTPMGPDLHSKTPAEETGWLCDRIGSMFAQIAEPLTTTDRR